MSESRVRIVDIAEELGVSTATVSNVIHGKTQKISDETVRRVQELLEQKQYIPSMAGILLAQNNSRIIGVVVHDHEKYGGHVLEDGFIASSLNALSKEIEKAGFFMMVKTTKEWNEIARFASMWNMEGLVLIGFCAQDYKDLRRLIRIPFVIYDGDMDATDRLANLVIDNFDGGMQAGKYLQGKGHEKVLCIADNDTCMDMERYQGLCEVLPGSRLMVVPMEKEERYRFYSDELESIREHTAIFAVSDYYAVDIMCFLMAHQIRIPEDMSVVGFDDTELGRLIQPPLTTIRQDSDERARETMRLLGELKSGQNPGETLRLKVSLVERESVTECERRL